MERREETRSGKKRRNEELKEEKKNRTVVKWRNEKRSNTQKTTFNKE